MQEKIIIEDGVVKVIREQPVLITDLDSLVTELKSTQIVDTPVLPEGTVTYSQAGSSKIIFVQRPETLVNCDYEGRIYTIAWPWQLYGMIIEKMVPVRICHFFLRGPIRHLHDEVFWTCLPNQHNEGGLCIAHGLTQELAGASNYVQVVERIVHFIYTAQFNNHIIDKARKHIPPEFKLEKDTVKSASQIFKAWEDWTKESGPQNDGGWRSVNRLEWDSNGTFADLRGSFRS